MRRDRINKSNAVKPNYKCAPLWRLNARRRSETTSEEERLELSAQEEQEETELAYPHELLLAPVQHDKGDSLSSDSE